MLSVLIEDPVEDRTVIDLDRFVVVKEDRGGRLVTFVFPEPRARYRYEQFARVLACEPEVQATLVKSAKPDSRVLQVTDVGLRALGDAPQRTIPNWLGPIRVCKPEVPDWALLVINGKVELFVRVNSVHKDLRDQLVL